MNQYNDKGVCKTAPATQGLLKILHGCPEHCPKLGAQFPRNNLCLPGVAESVAAGVSIHQTSPIRKEYLWYWIVVANECEGVQLSAGLCTVPSFLNIHRIHKKLFYRAMLSQEGNV